MIRSIRIFRVVRVFGKLPALKRVAWSLFASAGPMSASLSLVLIVVLVYASLGVTLFGDEDPSSFGSLDVSFFTLLRVAGSGSWLAEETSNEMSKKRLFLGFFVVLVSWVLMQLVTATMVDSFMRVTAAIDYHEERAKLTKRGGERANPLEPLLRRIVDEFVDEKDLQIRLQKLFQVLDTDKSKSLTAPEFTAAIRKLNFQPYIHFTTADFKDFTHDGALCDEFGGLDCEGFEKSMKEQLHCYAVGRLSQSLSRSSKEAAAAQVGVLKMVAMETLKLRRELDDTRGQLISLPLTLQRDLPNAVAEARKAALGVGKSDIGASAIWGPDGGDVFEQMARPLRDQLTASVVGPLREELRAMKASAPDPIPRSAQWADLRKEQSKPPEMHSQEPFAPPGSPVLLTSMQEGEAKFLQVHGKQSAKDETPQKLQRSTSWTESFSEPLQKLTDWVLPPSPAPPPRQASGGEGDDQRARAREALLRAMEAKEMGEVVFGGEYGSAKVRVVQEQPQLMPVHSLKTDMVLAFGTVQHDLGFGMSHVPLKVRSNRGSERGAETRQQRTAAVAATQTNQGGVTLSGSRSQPPANALNEGFGLPVHGGERSSLPRTNKQRTDARRHRSRSSRGGSVAEDQEYR